MKKYFAFLLMLFLGLGACTSKAQQAQEEQTEQSPAATQTQHTTQAPAQMQNVDVAGFKKLMAQPDVVILDVRTPQEVAQGAIEGAININLYDQDFDQKIEQLDKNKTYLVYCRSGRRSVTASNKMIAKGFTKVYNLLGGYNAWSAASRN